MFRFLKNLFLVSNIIFLFPPNRALSGGLGRSLRVLRLSDNGLSSLPVSLFGGEGGPPPPPSSSEEEDGGLSLRELYLSNNSLAGLPSALLGRLGHRLLVLNLSGNAVSNAWVNTRHSPFAALTHLAALDLSGNRMAFLPERALVRVWHPSYMNGVLLKFFCHCTI